MSDNIYQGLVDNSEIGEHILNDDRENFIRLYKKDLSFEHKPLSLFCAENGAFNILYLLFQSYKNEIRKLNIGEKRLLIRYILKSPYINNENKEVLIYYWFSNYVIGKKVRILLLLECLKYASSNIINFIKSYHSHLTIKYILELIQWIKEEKLMKERTEIISSYLVQYLEKSKNNVLYKILSLSISENYGYCLELDVFKKLKDIQKRNWYIYIIKGNHLNYHLYSEQDNINDKSLLNMEFLYLFTYCILLHQDMENKEITKVENMIKRIKKDNKMLNDESLNFLLNELSKIVLKQKFDKEIENKEITIRINKI